MPNHIKNIVTFKGDSEKIAELRRRVAYDYDENDPDNTGEGTLDFEKVVPMPKSLHIECGSRTDDGIEMYLTAINPETKDYGIKKVSTKYFKSIVKHLPHRYFTPYRTNLSEEDVEKMTKYVSLDELLKIGKTAISNVRKYGATTWYDWSIWHWGTKWNSYDICKCDNGFEFSTAWNAPHPIINKLAEMFPKVSIHHRWADEDIGSNCGELLYENGEIVEGKYSESMEEEEAIKFAKSVWGWED